jgi:four helix bundle protein
LSGSFRDLIVWRRAIKHTVVVYQLTSGFPDREIYGLSNQLRRACVSVASNIAEGYGRTSSREVKHFLGMALGSNSEVETQLVIAQRLGFDDRGRVEEAAALTSEVGTMLNAMIKNAKPSPPAHEAPDSSRRTPVPGPLVPSP